MTTDAKDALEAIRTRLAELTGNGKFVADMEQCDEDGEMCLTGKIIFVENHPGPYDIDFVEAGWFSEPEDAQRFVQLIDDAWALLDRVETLERLIRLRVQMDGEEARRNVQDVDDAS